MTDRPGKDESMDERIKRLEEMRERERSGELTGDDYERLEQDIRHVEQLLKDLHRKADRIRSARRANRLLNAFYACLGIILLATVWVVLIAAALVIGIVIAEILFDWSGVEFGTFRTGP